MNYETMNWEIEALRVRTAFDLKFECEFVKSRYGKRLMKAVLPNFQHSTHAPEIVKHIRLMVVYRPHSRNFVIGGKNSRVDIELSWQGEVESFDTAGKEPQTLLLAKGLFHLDLLTPEVETALGTAISAHDKLEWSLEYEQRYGL